MNESEKEGLGLFRKLGLKAYGDLGHIPLSDIFPEQSFPSNLHCEFDYFILFDSICLVGELSGLSNKRDITRKYNKFCNNFSLLQQNKYKSSDIFTPFNIPQEDRHLFDEVKDFRAFFIAEKLECFDVQLKSLPDIAVIYRNEWNTLKSYADSIEHFAQFPLLKMFGLTRLGDQGKVLPLEVKKNKLMRLPGKHIVKNSIRVDIFTFVASPADLLSISEVFRRELMPVITSSIDGNYQRPLVFKKLNDMRDLVSNPDFVFPNSILVALNENCDYDPQKEILNIPMEYGSISVIDGQHRLFSYASPKLTNKLRKDAKILVTALKYRTNNPTEITQCSAATFVDINQNQKKITSSHIDEIAYSILGHTTPRALAAQIILRLNQSPSNPWSGLFSSPQTTEGTIKAATVIGSLSTIISLKKINSLITARSGKKYSNKCGYEILFDVNDITELSNAEDLIEQGIHCLREYFVKVKKVFDKDWTDRGIPEESTLGYTKVFAALIRLLGEFVKEGLGWNNIEEELKKIKKHILKKRNLSNDHAGVVLKKGDTHIPDDEPTMFSSYRFLNENRRASVSIRDIK